MFCWLQKAAPVTVASWLLSELQKTEGIQKCRDPYQGVLVVCPGNEYFFVVVNCVVMIPNQR
ncbi:uncharacterized protein LOC143234499 isoform X2 [Tachypleus tridentatus]|uniref:uncharacterized protein LOC143234499 isoform X2 n=1 Tax=Tachypleus tridentatus TaxID=6853 RepID=UPI003FD061C7